jgi:hypothetical protein
VPDRKPYDLFLERTNGSQFTALIEKPRNTIAREDRPVGGSPGSSGALPCTCPSIAASISTGAGGTPLGRDREHHVSEKRSSCGMLFTAFVSETA